MRLKHPSMRPAGPTVRLSFDGSEIEALPGETVAAALAASGVTTVRQTRSGAPRGPFCGMGVCQECRVTIDGRAHALACQTLCRAGQIVHAHDAAGGL